MAGRVLRAIGDTYLLDAATVAADLDEVTADRFTRADRVIRALRSIADSYESEVLALTELRKRPPQLEDREAQLLEGAITEVGQLGVVHDAGGRVGVVRRVLGVLLHRAGDVVAGAHGLVSCSVVSPGAVTPGAASDATVQAVGGSPAADTRAGAVEPHTPAPARGRAA